MLDNHIILTDLKNHLLNNYGNSVKDIILFGSQTDGNSKDYSDYDIAFLKLWSVLEFLTNTLKAKYDNTIKRTAFCFKEYDFHCQVLNHLRDYRNKSVHTGSSDNSGVKIYIYQLKRYVEELLIFHLSTKMKFSNIESASEFLDLSQDAEFLREKCQLYQKAIKFLSD